MSNSMVDGLIDSILGKFSVKDLEYAVSRNFDLSVFISQYMQSQLLVIRMMNSITKYQITEKETIDYLSLNYNELYKYISTNNIARAWLLMNIRSINKLII